MQSAYYDHIVMPSDPYTRTLGAAAEGWAVRDADSASSADDVETSKQNQPSTAFKARPMPDGGPQAAREGPPPDGEAGSEGSPRRDGSPIAWSAALGEEGGKSINNPVVVEPGKVPQEREKPTCLDYLARRSKERAWPQLGLGPKSSYDVKQDRGLREKRKGSPPRIGNYVGEEALPDNQSSFVIGSSYRIHRADKGRLIIDAAPQEEPPAGVEDASESDNQGEVNVVADEFGGGFISYMYLAKERSRPGSARIDARFGTMENDPSARGLQTRTQKRADLLKIQQRILNQEM
ncbi:unnamed protein product [Amoebophrya sp. A25]|nr:unnamed protein product [Amoebophrya sp. A25]|eukprot:GSA25T00016272001.1